MQRITVSNKQTFTKYLKELEKQFKLEWHSFHFNDENMTVYSSRNNDTSLEQIVNVFYWIDEKKVNLRHVIYNNEYDMTVANYQITLYL